MIEIVFSDSACGSLKIAQSYGKGKYQGGGCIGVFISHEDGKKPAKKEIKAVMQESEKKERMAWESAVPFGGSTSDIYGFSLMLSMGDISGDDKRIEILEHIHNVYPGNDGRQTAQEILKRVNENLKMIKKRAAAGESVRIWYSSQPDEMCGLYWFMNYLNQWNVSDGQVCIIKLPEWEACSEGTIVRKNNWGEISPGEWHRYMKLQKTVSPIFIQDCASHWHELQRENTPLRIVLNGRLVSASEKAYDDFIIREINAESEEFCEARIIGNVIGKYQLGISDSCILFRIEEMINEGKLAVVSGVGEDMPVYRRQLKKRSKIIV